MNWSNWFHDRRTRAKIADIVDEAPGMRTFVLAPNHWPGHRAGQFVPVDVEVDGRRVRRCYSISSGSARPNARRIAITVKRVPNGRVSAYMHDRLKVGDTVHLGEPAGEFVLPEVTPAKLCFIAGGSGITPIAAIARELSANVDAVIVYASAERHAFVPVLGKRAILHTGILTAAQLHAYVPDLAERTVYTCGPQGLMDLVPNAISERFSIAIPKSGDAAKVRLAIAGREVLAAGSGALLDQLERAGERPKFGCRMGVCNTCVCTKTTGVTENVLTGEVSAEPGAIKLCSTIARSDLELEL